MHTTPLRSENRHHKPTHTRAGRGPKKVAKRIISYNNISRYLREEIERREISLGRHMGRRGRAQRLTAASRVRAAADGAMVSPG